MLLNACSDRALWLFRTVHTIRHKTGLYGSYAGDVADYFQLLAVAGGNWCDGWAAESLCRLKAATPGSPDDKPSQAKCTKLDAKLYAA